MLAYANAVCEGKSNIYFVDYPCEKLRTLESSVNKKVTI